MRLKIRDGVWTALHRDPLAKVTCNVAAAVIGGAVIGGGASLVAGSKAASAQTRASRDAITAQERSETRALALQAPGREAGYRATAAMMDLAGLDRGKPSSAGGAMDFSYNPETGSYEYSGGGTAVSRAQGEPPNLADYAKYDFKADPGYEFRFNEGNRALERGAAARGGLLSGGYGRTAIRYAQDYASSEYKNVFDRIATIAGYGNSATSQGAQTIVNTGTNTGNALINAGEARASGYIAQGNAFSGAVNQIGTAYGYGLLGRGGGGVTNPYATNTAPGYS